MRILLICITTVFMGCAKEDYVGKTLGSLIPANEACAIMRVDEGNIFYCETPNLSVLKIKLLGVDIYEGKEKESKEFTKSILNRGSNVWISLDNRVREKKGMLSAFVFLQDKTFFNGLLIREGYGFQSFEGKEAEYKDKFDEIYYEDLSNPIEIEDEIKIENNEKAPWIN